MLEEIISQNSPEIKIELKSAVPSFFMFPTFLFAAGRKVKWTARFLIGAGYLYALCYNGTSATTTTEELRKVLSTESKSRVEELLEKLKALNEAVIKKAGKETGLEAGEREWIKTKRGRGGRTVVELVLPQEFSYAYPENKFFPVPKIAFLLPVSAQAKALYLYLHYLKDRETNRAVAGMRRLAESLHIGLGRINGFVEELVNRGVLSVRNSRKGTEFFVRSPVYWPDGTLLEIAQTYSLSHPFLKEWSITLPKNSPIGIHQPEKFPNRDTPSKNSPIGIHQIPQYGYTPQENSPIGIHPKPGGSREPEAQEPLTTSNKIITTSIYPTSTYNKEEGGVDNIRKCECNAFRDEGSRSEKKRRTAGRRGRIYEVPAENDETNALPKRNAFQKVNRKEAAELGLPNKLPEGLDVREVEEIKAFLSKVWERVERDARWCGVGVEKLDGEFWKGLRKVYGEEWKVLALMYELLSLKNHSRYSRKVNTSPVGLLVSFALKKSPTSFRDFISAYERVFGAFEELKRIEERRENALLALEIEAEVEPEYLYLLEVLKKLPPYDEVFSYLEGWEKEEDGTVVFFFTAPKGADLFKERVGKNLPFPWKAAVLKPKGGEKWKGA